MLLLISLLARQADQLLQIFLIIVLVLHSDGMVQLFRVVAIYLITPRIELSLLVRFPLQAEQRQRRPQVVAVIQVHKGEKPYVETIK